LVPSYYQLPLCVFVATLLCLLGEEWISHIEHKKESICRGWPFLLFNFFYVPCGYSSLFVGEERISTKNTKK